MKKLLLLISSALFCLIGAHAENVVPLPSGYEPCSVNDMQVQVLTEDGKQVVRLSFVTPTQMRTYDSKVGDYVYKELPGGISRVVIQRSDYNMQEYAAVATLDSPTRGEALSWTDRGEDGAGLPLGRYDYRVLVYVGETSSFLWNWDAIATGIVIGQIPADFAEGSTRVGVADNQVTITVAVPSLDSEGESMTMQVGLQILEYISNGMITTPTIIQTIDQVPVGADYPIVLTGVTKGVHSYSVSAFTASGSNHGVTVNTFVGKDKPGYVTSLSVAYIDEGIRLTWEAPTGSQNNGNMGDPQSFTYNVFRKTSAYGSEQLIAEGLNELSYIDTKTYAEETIVYYSVCAVNDAGAGYNATTDAILVGPSAALPYTENFDREDGYGGYEMEQSTWTKPSSRYANWNVATNLDVNGTNVTPHNGQGMGYAMYSSWFGSTECWDALQSGNIDFSNAAQPTISLWYYDLANGGSDMTLSIQTRLDAGTYEDAFTIALGEAEESGWREIKIEVPRLCGTSHGQVRILVNVQGRNVYPVIIDQLSIFDAENPTNIHSLDTTIDNAIYTLGGIRIPRLQHGINIVGKRKIFGK